MTDPIADYLTRIRNAVMARHKVVEIPASNLKKEMTKVLHDKGYILNYKFVDDGVQGSIKIALKYHPESKVSDQLRRRRMIRVHLNLRVRVVSFLLSIYHLF